MRISSVILARCPACHEGPILRHVFGIHRRCPRCSHDYQPESGYFLGAMAISFLVTALLLVPPMVVLKFTQVDLTVLMVYPFIQFIVVGSLLAIYSRVLWLHLEYRITERLDQKDVTDRSSR